MFFSKSFIAIVSKYGGRAFPFSFFLFCLACKVRANRLSLSNHSDTIDKTRQVINSIYSRPVIRDSVDQVFSHRNHSRRPSVCRCRLASLLPVVFSDTKREHGKRDSLQQFTHALARAREKVAHNIINWKAVWNRWRNILTVGWSQKVKRTLPYVFHIGRNVVLGARIKIGFVTEHWSLQSL